MKNDKDLKEFNQIQERIAHFQEASLTEKSFNNLNLEEQIIDEQVAESYYLENES
jgi:hypothetical protein